MSVSEIEHNIDTLPEEAQEEILHHLLEKRDLLELWEDLVDVQISLEAEKKGDYIDYMQIRKELFGEETDAKN